MLNYRSKAQQRLMFTVPVLVMAVVMSMGVVHAEAALLTMVYGDGVVVNDVISSGTFSCPLSLGFMKFGVANKTADVVKLQTFLKESQGLDIDVTGIFDEKTEQAVEDFQRKYMSDVLGPWEATKPSGIVYITTAKKIDQLVCGTPVAYDQSELAAIDSWNRAVAAAKAGSGTFFTEIGSDDPTMKAHTASRGSTVVGDQAAAAAEAGQGASLINRFWHFLFGR